jgi:uroporphyrinogen decarboxylase
MNSRERYIALLTGQPIDHMPFHLYWGPWGTTWERWQREGAPKEASHLAAYYKCDPLPTFLPINAGPCPAFEYKVLGEDDETRTWIDSWGIRRRNFKHAESMSQFLEFPIKTSDDWERYKRERLAPADPRRLQSDWLSIGQKCQEQGVGIKVGGFPNVGVFGTYRWLLGDEECLIALYTMPDIAHDIMNHMTSVYLAVFEQVAAKVHIDEIHLWEDMCGKQGPLISPEHFREFMLPCYNRIKDFARRNGIAIISVDTDGQPDKIIPPMMEGGVNMMLPFEVQAGSDVNYFRKKYPGLAILGGIDKRALARDHKAIDAELARIRPAIATGMYIPELDHLVPDDVSWENYDYYARQLKKMILGG